MLDPFSSAFFPVVFPNMAPRDGRGLRRLDALVLCRRHAGSELSTWETLVTKRPNLLAGEDLPPEPQQRRSLEKRVQLKAAALALFGDKGFERTSVDDIASRANLAVGGFYLHYRSKRQLLLALMDDLLTRSERDRSSSNSRR